MHVVAMALVEHDAASISPGIRTEGNYLRLNLRTWRNGKLRKTNDEPQEFQLDGDEFGETRSLRTWVDPGALTVKVPA